MIFLILSVVLHIGIFTLFRLYPRFRIHTFQAIVINYYVCVITGSIFVGNTVAFSKIASGETWAYLGILLGLFFVATFNLIARTAQIFSITVSSVASKISMAIPVGFALFVFNLESKPFDLWNYAGLAMSMFAIVLMSVRADEIKSNHTGITLMLLPISVFVFNGTIDAILNYTNYRYLEPGDEAVFPIVAFISAATVGTLVLILRKETINKRSVVGGMLLGVINYFSIFLLMKGLSAFNNDGALFFPIFNMGIIAGATIVSVVAFKERMKTLNIVGLAMALLAIVLIAYQELWAELM